MVHWTVVIVVAGLLAAAAYSMVLAWAVAERWLRRYPAFVLMQLVGDHVTMFDSMKDRRIAHAEVEAKFGCPPELVPDALGIWGDSSDNIPGVKGIGEKGAKALLAKWKGLDDIYEHIDEITPPGAKTKLENDRDNAFENRASQCCGLISSTCNRCSSAASRSSRTCRPRRPTGRATRLPTTT